MIARVSAKSAQREAQGTEKRLVKAWVQDARSRDTSISPAGPRQVTNDSFQNFLLGMGIGTDNANNANYYGFNPITRNRILCEWIYRGSWVGGVAVDLVANDMTRSGIEHPSMMSPDDAGRMDREAKRLNVWAHIAECVKWGRLYGGAICVALVDGQDLATELKVETIGRDQFKGLITLDRWMLDPTLNDLVTDLGPHLGKPKFYKVMENAPALRGSRIHHTRVMVRHVGVKLPYQQQLMENLWGLSIFERLYDRLTAFDMATTGAAQLVNKAYIRCMKIKDLKQIIAGGGVPMQGLMNFMAYVRRTQGIEGITLLDVEDEWVTESHGAFSGLDAIVMQFAQQVAGALQIPMVRLMGQSPGGLNATGEGDQRIYYDNLAQSWEQDIGHGAQTVYQLIAKSCGIRVPEDFEVSCAPFDQLSDTDKAEVASKDAATVTSVLGSSLISEQTAMQELKQSSRRTGRFTNITQDAIDKADAEIPAAPSPQDLMAYQQQLKQGDPNGPGGGPPGGPGNNEPGNKPVPGAKGARDAKEFVESQHPRKDDGEFTAGGGGSGGARASHVAATGAGKERRAAGGGALPAHIAALKIPPAWTDVTYSEDPKAALLATGKDAKGRVQSVYSEEHSARQAAAKFARVQELQKKGAAIRTALAGAQASTNKRERDSADALATIIATGIRPGSTEDTGAEVQAYGATTLQAQHVVANEKTGQVTLKFVGKKGVNLAIPVTDPQVAALLTKRVAGKGPDEPVFPNTNAGALLEFTHKLGGGGFKTKDFRTLKGTTTAMDEVASMDPPADEGAYKRQVRMVAKKVSEALGNTPIVALQSYIDPSVFTEWKGKCCNG